MEIAGQAWLDNNRDLQHTQRSSGGTPRITGSAESFSVLQAERKKARKSSITTRMAEPEVQGRLLEKESARIKSPFQSFVFTGALHTVTERTYGNQFSLNRICASSQIQTTVGT